MKTADLMRKNKQLNKELLELKKQTQLFVQDVLSNPENQGLVLQNKNPVFVSQNLDFHVVNEQGKFTQVPTILANRNSENPGNLTNRIAGQQGGKKRHLSETLGQVYHKRSRLTID